jgi:hypothetical protein
VADSGVNSADDALDEKAKMDPIMSALLANLQAYKEALSACLVLEEDALEEAETEGREDDAFEECTRNEDEEDYQCVLDEAFESPLSHWVHSFTAFTQGVLDGIDDSDIYAYRERQKELALSWSSVRETQEQLDLVIQAIARAEVPVQFLSAWQEVMEHRVADIDGFVDGWLEFYGNGAEADFTSAIQLLRDLPIEDRANQEQDVRQLFMNSRRLSDARDELQEIIFADADSLHLGEEDDNVADGEECNFEDVAIPEDADTDSPDLAAIFLTKRQLPVVVHSRVIDFDIPRWVEQDLMTTIAMALNYMLMAAPLNITAHTATLVFDPGGRCMRKSVHVRSS